MRLHQGLSVDPIYSSHDGDAYLDQPTGCDLILDPAIIQNHFPYLSKETVALLHTRRCGWFSGQQFGRLLFEKATQAGVRFLNARVEAISLVDDRVDQVHLRKGRSTFKVASKIFVNAAGPHILQVALMLGIRLPVYNERRVQRTPPQGIHQRQS
jgi:glycine/D-amino acid oxidase-like deaminating enzyme